MAVLSLLDLLHQQFALGRRANTRVPCQVEDLKGIQGGLQVRLVLLAHGRLGLFLGGLGPALHCNPSVDLGHIVLAGLAKAFGFHNRAVDMLTPEFSFLFFINCSQVLANELGVHRYEFNQLEPKCKDLRLNVA